MKKINHMNAIYIKYCIINNFNIFYKIIYYIYFDLYR